jgi:dCTP deaminase
MMLGYEDLQAAIDGYYVGNGTAVPDAYRMAIEPFDSSWLQSASIDLRLGGSYSRWLHGERMIQTVAPKRLEDIDERDWEIVRGLQVGDAYVVRPGEQILTSVDVRIQLGNGLAARLEGKSTSGRRGQLMHMAGFIDPGFQGTIVLEPVNFAPFPVVYTVGDPVVQLSVFRLLTPTEHPYGTIGLGSRYQGQRVAQPPIRSQSYRVGGSL